MLLDSGDVVRRHIRQYPASTTAVNVERLPPEEDLRNMELRYREEPASIREDSRRFPMWALAFVVIGYCYSSALLHGPAVAARFWNTIQATDGLSIVLGMLAAMLGLASALVVGFLVPRQVTLVVVVLTFVAGATLALSTFASTSAVAVASTGLIVFSLLRWQRSLTAFHLQWLKCEPGFTSEMEIKLASSPLGWLLPKFDETMTILHRFVSYEAPRSGAAGVWFPPDALSGRLLTTSTLCAAVLVSAAVLNAGFLIGFVLSAIVLGVAGAFALGRAAYMTKCCKALCSADGRSWWEKCATRLRNSQHVARDPISGDLIREAEHLLLGYEPWQSFPILLHQSLLHGHAYIVGRTGSGKTSMGLMQLLIQTIRGYHASETTKQSSGTPLWSEKAPVVIIDLKGDPVLFQTAKEEAERRGQKFRFFTLEQSKASFRFNPFSGFGSGQARTVPQLVQLVLDALGLYYGAGYGRHYFSERSRYMLAKILSSKRAINNFKDLYRALDELYTEKKSDYRECFELISVIESLTYYDQLVTTKLQDQDAEADTIQMGRVLEDREVVYFWLPSVQESVSVAVVGKLVLFNLKSAAEDRKNADQPRRQAYVFIDECQKLAGENFQQVLQQARSAGSAVILANQSLSDLKTPDFDLRPTIWINTNVKMYFSTLDTEEVKMISEFSGLELQQLPGQESEIVRPRLSVGDILAISDHPQRLLLQISGGSGYTQFGGLVVPVQTDWPISKAEADERETRPWPGLRGSKSKSLVVSTVAPQVLDATVREEAKRNYGAEIKGLMDE